jgi:hypothetical protein
LILFIDYPLNLAQKALQDSHEEELEWLKSDFQGSIEAESAKYADVGQSHTGESQGSHVFSWRICSRRRRRT